MFGEMFQTWRMGAEMSGFYNPCAASRCCLKLTASVIQQTFTEF